MTYSESTHSLIRRPTRIIKVGAVEIGGNNPIRIQSMTTSDTKDAIATSQQIMRLADVGCEIVRITVQGMKEADTCEDIKNILVQKGYNTPLVADIHFYPPAAIRVVDFVEKVRINPGNFVDKRATFKQIEYDDSAYAKELEKIEEKFAPLVLKCKSLGRAMRIGTNHGSLSDRILNRYGDTPYGMVESALEYARICIKYDFHNFLFSMKSSNPQVMILAYRLLAKEMYRLGWDYPLHLGVTEAGLGEDGRIKSAMGIGSLLLEGLGDTIRVSLTEDPWHEIDPCKRLIQFANVYKENIALDFKEKHRNFENIEKRKLQFPSQYALHKGASVFISPKTFSTANDLYKDIDCDLELGQPKLKSATVDTLVVKQDVIPSVTLNKLIDAGVGVITENDLVTIKEAKNQKMLDRFNLVSHKPLCLVVEEEDWEFIKELKPELLIFKPKDNYLYRSRKFFDFLQEQKILAPVILKFAYNCSKEDLVIRAAAEYGALLLDGFGEGIWMEGPYENEYIRALSFNLLQAARLRIFKTDFISCPSCGRTLFDLQEVTKRIKERTEHLPGVKIAIMGCIVNGPGEMADADFGYVGSLPKKIDLYVGKMCVEKGIPFEEADDRLVELIKRHGKWIDKVETGL